MYARLILAKTALAILAICVMHNPVGAEEAVKLRYKAKSGDKSIYHSVLSVEQTQSVMGQEFQINNRQEDYTTYVVKKVAKDGTILFDVTNNFLKVDGDFGPGGKFQFDSKSDERDTSSQLGAAVTPLFERLSGSILGVELSPLGKVKKITGYAELVKDVLENNPIASQFAGGGTDKAALSGFQDLFVIFEDKAIKPGDTWESPYKIELPKMGEFDGKRIYTFVAPDKVGDTPTLKISVTLELSGELEIDTGQSQVSGDLELDDSSGTIQFDPVTGCIVFLESEQVMSGDLTVKAGGQTIPVDFEQTIKLSRKLVDRLPK